MPKTSPDAPDGGCTLTFHDLIIIAVEALDGGRKGSSVHAIKKYILVQYGVEVSVKNNHHFKRGLRKALEEESLIRVTGVGGATGSFRLPSKSKKKSPPTAGNATTRTTRKKSPPTNIDDETPRKKLPAKTAVTIQKKARTTGLVQRELSEDHEEPEEEDMVDGNNNSTTESIKQDDEDSEEDPAVSEDENETNGTLIPPPSSSASHRSANEEVASDSEESTDGEGEHNEIGGCGTTGSAFNENPTSLDLSRHDRSIDMGGSDQMNSLTVEAPSSRNSNMTSYTTNTQVRQGEIKTQVVNETILDEYQSDTTVYDDDNESDVSAIEVLRANQDSNQTEDEDPHRYVFIRVPDEDKWFF